MRWNGQAIPGCDGEPWMGFRRGVKFSGLDHYDGRLYAPEEVFDKVRIYDTGSLEQIDLWDIDFIRASVRSTRPG